MENPRKMFSDAYSVQMAFQDGGLRVSFYALYVSARINCRFVYNLNHDRFK